MPHPGTTAPATAGLVSPRRRPPPAARPAAQPRAPGPATPRRPPGGAYDAASPFPPGRPLLRAAPRGTARVNRKERGACFGGRRAAPCTRVAANDTPRSRARPVQGQLREVPSGRGRRPHPLASSPHHLPCFCVRLCFRAPLEGAAPHLAARPRAAARHASARRSGTWGRGAAG